MPVTLAVLVAALVAAGVVWALSRSPATPDPADPAAEERWLVGWLRRHPRLGAPARAIDRQVVGGLMLAVALAIVFVTALVVGIVFDMVDRDSGLAEWDTAVAEWGSENATSWSTGALDALTDLGGTTYLVVICVAVAIYDYVRHRNLNVALFLLVVLVGVSAINNGLKLIVDRDRPDVTAPRQPLRLVVPVGALRRGGGGMVRAGPRRQPVLAAAGTGRGGRGRRDRHRGRGDIPRPARRPLAHRRRRRGDGRLGLVPAHRARVRRADAAPRRAGRRAFYNADVGRHGEQRAAVVARLGPFEHHPGIPLAQLDDTDVIGEERSVLDFPSRRVPASSDRPAQPSGDVLAEA